MSDIPVEIFEPNPNRWVVLTEVRLVHPSYGAAVGRVTDGDCREPHDTLDAAMTEARRLLADAAQPLKPGAVRQVELVGVSIRAYRQPGAFRPLPLASAEWQEAWNNGPGAEA
jgi:hypothetical protein